MPTGSARMRQAGRASIHDVARVAGVSTATVSRALRGLDRVSDSTRERVLEAAAGLQYVASPTAASLASGKTSVVGVVVPFLQRWFFANVLDGIEELLRQHGYHVLLFNVGLRASTRTLMLDQRLLAKRLDALLVIAADLESQEVRLLEELGLPVVTIGLDLPGRDRVGIDDVAAARTATEHLIGLGHRRIAVVGGDPGSDVHSATAVDRLAGFREATGAAGLPVQRGYLCSGDWAVAGGTAAGLRLLTLPLPPTAVLAASDEMAIGVLVAARTLGLAVPGDLSVIGIDDHEMAMSHDLTTIAQPVRELAHTAGRLLVDALAGRPRGPRRVTILPTRLIVRGSTGPP